VGAGEAMLGAAEGGELALQLADLLAHDVLAMVEHAGIGRFERGAQAGLLAGEVDEGQAHARSPAVEAAAVAARLLQRRRYGKTRGQATAPARRPPCLIQGKERGRIRD